MEMLNQPEWIWVGVQVQEGIPIWQVNLNSDYRLAKNSTKRA